MGDNVLITGGAGFIGTHLSRLLLAGGYSITVLDNFSPQIHGGQQQLPPDLAAHVRLVYGDVRDLDAWRQALPGQKVVVNLAAETGTGQSMYEVQRYQEVNLAGTANLYDLIAKGQAPELKCIILASSRAIYGEGAYVCQMHGVVYPMSRPIEDKRQGRFDPVCPICRGDCVSIPTPENAPLQPSSFYGLTKQVQEQMTLMFGRVFGISSFALRYQNVYGPGQSLKNPYTGILAVFSNLARMKAAINVFEDGQESRDFVYVEDVVHATIACLKSKQSGAHMLNVGSDERTTVLEVARLVNQYFGGHSEIKVTGAFREGDIRHGMADLAHSRALIGFEPRWRFSEGLSSFLEWASESELVAGSYERSLTELKARGLLHGA